MSLQRRHGTAIAIRGVGVLLMGGSGVGKSSLALRLIHQGAVLIADDMVDISSHENTLSLSPPATIAGIIELYGVGLIRLPYVQSVNCALVVQCVSEISERYPPRSKWIMEGIAIPEITLQADESAAPEKIAALVEAMQSGNWLNEDWSSFGVPLQSLLR